MIASTAWLRKRNKPRKQTTQIQLLSLRETCQLCKQGGWDKPTTLPGVSLEIQLNPAQLDREGRSGKLLILFIERPAIKGT